MAESDAPIDVDMLVHEHVEDADDAQGVSILDVEPDAASADGAKGDVDADSTTMQFDPPSIPSQEDSSVPFSDLGELLHEKAVKRNGLAVIVPPAQNRWEYKVFEEDEKVVEILEEYDDAGFVEYLVVFADGSEDIVSLEYPIFKSTYFQHMAHRLPPLSVNYQDYSYLCPSTQLSTYLSTYFFMHFHSHSTNALLFTSTIPPNSLSES